jgi:hypothetical protein
LLVAVDERVVNLERNPRVIQQRNRMWVHRLRVECACDPQDMRPGRLQRTGEHERNDNKQLLQKNAHAAMMAQSLR